MILYPLDRNVIKPCGFTPAEYASVLSSDISTQIEEIKVLQDRLDNVYASLNSGCMSNVIDIFGSDNVIILQESVESPIYLRVKHPGAWEYIGYNLHKEPHAIYINFRKSEGFVNDLPVYVFPYDLECTTQSHFQFNYNLDLLKKQIDYLVQLLLIRFCPPTMIAKMLLSIRRFFLTCDAQVEVIDQSMQILENEILRDEII